MTNAILCECGTFFQFNKRKANKYCSTACYRVAQRAGEYKRGHGPEFPSAPCAHCGETVQRRSSMCRDGEKSDKVFCNRKCYDDSRTTEREKRTMDCPHCKVKFIPSNLDVKYCSDACWKAEKKAKPQNCVNCDCVFTPVKLKKSTGLFISHNGGKTCSAWCHNQWIRNNPERKRKIGDSERGVKHHNWQGGKSQLNNTSNRGPNWAKQRAAALKRDRHLCVDCGMHADESRQTYGRGLDVDHVVPYHNFGSYVKANALSNLQCRCASCHRIAEAKRGMVQMVLPMQDNERRHQRGYAIGARHPKAKLIDFQVLAIRRRAGEGESRAVLSLEYGVTLSNISSIVKGKIWKNLLIGAAGRDTS